LQLFSSAIQERYYLDDPIPETIALQLLHEQGFQGLDAYVELEELESAGLLLSCKRSDRYHVTGEAKALYHFYLHELPLLDEYEPLKH